MLQVHAFKSVPDEYAVHSDNFAQGTFPESIRQFVSIGIGALNLVVAIMTTVFQFLKANECRVDRVR